MAPPPEMKAMMKFVLKSDDGKEFTLTQDVAFQSNLIKKMIEDLGIDDPESPMLTEPLTVSNVDAWTLEKIIEYCTRNRGTAYKVKSGSECQRVNLTSWDEQWMEVESDQLLSMLNVSFDASVLVSVSTLQASRQSTTLTFPAPSTSSPRRLPTWPMEKVSRNSERSTVSSTTSPLRRKKNCVSVLNGSKTDLMVFVIKYAHKLQSQTV